MRATGSLDNLLGFALRDQELRGRATVSSSGLDLNEWRSKEKATDVIAVPPHVDFALKASAARVTYGALTLVNMRGNLRVNDQRVTLDDLRMETLRGSVVANGSYESTVRAAFDVADGRLHVKPFVMKMNGIDMTVAGSNGIDPSLNYDLALAVPHALLGGGAGRAASVLAATARREGTVRADSLQAQAKRQANGLARPGA